MKAIVLQEPGPPNTLTIQEIPTPSLENDEVLVQVKAISINPVDTKTRNGKGLFGRLKEQQPLILGWDISGIVSASRSPLFKVGDEVFGMVNFPGHGKGYAEFVAAPAAHLALKPKNISHEEAAAATLAALTAYQAVVKHAKVQRGQQVLIHAAAGGVGHFAVQIASELGAIVTGTSSSKNKSFVLELGARHHIDYHGYNWRESKESFDFVLDTIGGENIDHSLEVTKAGGTLISIPTGLNEQVTEKAKAKGVNGYFFLVQSNGDDMKAIASLLEEKKLLPTVSKIFGFEEMPKAHQEVETGRTVGKIIVRL